MNQADVFADGPDDDLAHARQFTHDNGYYGGGTDGNGDGLLYMISDASAPGTEVKSGMAMDIEPNPWGCHIRADDPHESDKKPGPGNIQAKAAIECSVAPPDNIATIWQELSKWDGSDFSIEAENESICPSRVGKPRPHCYPTLRHSEIMRAYVNTACTIGATDRWVELAEATMTVDGIIYSGLSGSVADVYCEGPQ